MSVLLNVTTGTPGVSNAFTTFMSGPLGQNNPALGIEYDSQLAWILTLVSGGLFLISGIFALVNLGREGHCVHFWLMVFALERVATLAFRAVLYKSPGLIWIKLFEILEAVGTVLIVSAAYQVLAGFVRAKMHGKTCCATSVQHFVSTAAFVAISAGAAVFVVGVVLQDRASASQSQFDKGWRLRQYAVVVYGGVMVVYNCMCLIMLCAPGKRGVGWSARCSTVAVELLIVGLALSAKVGFQLYALWMPDQPVGALRYFSTRFFFSLLVFPELLALSFLTSRGFVRHAMTAKMHPLPGPGGYPLGTYGPPADAYLPQQQYPLQQPMQYQPQQRDYTGSRDGGSYGPPRRQSSRDSLSAGSPPSHGQQPPPPPYQPLGPWASKW